MGKKEKDKRLLRRNLLGVCVFLLALPVLWPMGGAAFAMREILPGQVSAAEPTGEEGADTTGERETVEEEPAKETGLFGIDDLKFKEEEQVAAAYLSREEVERMQDFSYLQKTYYTTDSRTMLLPTDISVNDALAKDFTIDTDVDGPKVLIFHTHISEAFADSDMSKGKEEGIWGAGEYLKELLEEKYGIEVLHHDGVYDQVNGKGQVTGAYERMEPDIRKILEENPSIQVCIDMHRDGVPEGTHLVTEVNGKPTAKIMFFNGLCRLNQNGQAVPTPGLDNPYVSDNLAFSLQMQTQSAARFPDFNRKIYLNAYRFSLHMLPRSTLIEVGAQTNTKEEVHNAMEPLAEILAAVLLGAE